MLAMENTSKTDHQVRLVESCRQGWETKGCADNCRVLQTTSANLDEAGGVLWKQMQTLLPLTTTVSGIIVPLSLDRDHHTKWQATWERVLSLIIWISVDQILQESLLQYI